MRRLDSPSGTLGPIHRQGRRCSAGSSALLSNGQLARDPPQNFGGLPAIRRMTPLGRKRSLESERHDLVTVALQAFDHQAKRLGS